MWEKGTLHIENNTITREQIKDLLYGEGDLTIAGMLIGLGVFILMLGVAILASVAKDKR